MSWLTHKRFFNSTVKSDITYIYRNVMNSSIPVSLYHVMPSGPVRTPYEMQIRPIYRCTSGLFVVMSDAYSEFKPPQPVCIRRPAHASEPSGFCTRFGISKSWEVAFENVSCGILGKCIIVCWYILIINSHDRIQGLVYIAINHTFNL